MRWYSVSLKKGVKERYPAIYARKAKIEGEESKVLLFNGAYAHWVESKESVRARYDLGPALSEEKSKAVEDRYMFEIHR